MFEPDYEMGFVYRGNLTRLKAAMNRAERGEALTVCFLGGSITQGSLASMPENCYAYRTFQWWKATFPKAEHRYLNAGIGGTSSQFGAARAEEDVLAYHPDVIVVEFSVNDANTPFFRETYEGLLRRLLSAQERPAVLLLHNVCYDSGASAEQVHREIGLYYDLPSVSVRPTLYEAIRRGLLDRREITPDDLHPNDEGHRLLAGHLISMLSRAYGERRLPESPEQPFPAPLTENRFEKSVRLRNFNADALCDGFTPDSVPQTHITQCFRCGYTARNRGDRISFTVYGTELAVQYRKTVNRPAPAAKVMVDGMVTAVLDADFEEDWGDCLYLQTVGEHLQPGVHTLTVELTETHPDDLLPFYLVSVIVSEA